MIKPRYLLLVIWLAALIAWAWPRPLTAPDAPHSANLAEVEPAATDSTPAVVIPTKLTALFGGDLMLGRDIAQKYQANSFADLFTDFDSSLFAAADVSFVNFEAPISSESAVPALAANNLRFIAPAVSTKVLTSNHIKFAGLANNHTLTWGREVFNQTKSLIEAAVVTPVGRPDAVESTDIPDVTGRLPVTVIAVNYVDGDMPGVTDTIAAASARGRTVIVVPHWGVEYQAKHNATQESLARAYVAAGADLVIGGHPHVIQDAQLVDGIPVFYSLGNLVFDQYFSTATQRGLLIGVALTKSEVQLTVRPVKEVKGRPSLLMGPEQTDILNDFCGYFSSVTDKDCASGVFTVSR